MLALAFQSNQTCHNFIYSKKYYTVEIDNIFRGYSDLMTFILFVMFILWSFIVFSAVNNISKNCRFLKNSLYIKDLVETT